MIQSHNFVTVYLTQEGALGMDVWCALMLLDATLKGQRHRQILMFGSLGEHLNTNTFCCWVVICVVNIEYVLLTKWRASLLPHKSVLSDDL